MQHMSSTTTERTIDELSLIFAPHGIPEEVVSDNGPQFTSNEFAEFVRTSSTHWFHPITPNLMGQGRGP